MDKQFLEDVKELLGLEEIKEGVRFDIWDYIPKEDLEPKDAKEYDRLKTMDFENDSIRYQNGIVWELVEVEEEIEEYDSDLDWHLNGWKEKRL